MEKLVLVVDDSKFNRLLLKNLLVPEYEVIEAENGKEALDLAEEYKEDLCAVLLDIVMPIMTGIDFLKAARQNGYLEMFPVLIVTSEQDMDLVGECFDLGISDFIRKPATNEFVKNRVDRLVNVYQERNELKEKASLQSSTMKTQYQILREQTKKLKENNENIIQVLGTIVEYRNLESGNHIQRIGSFTKILAAQMMQDYPEYDLTPAKIRIMVSASALHDVGKILIPDSILLKPGKLTDDEFEYMKSHTVRGYDIIDQISSVWDDEYVKYSKDIARWHHEKYDGNGYPDNLKGDDIPIAAQIVSLADCYDALINDSVYRQAYPLDVAFHMIKNGECGVFSPKLLSALTKSRPFLEDVAKKLQDDADESKELAEEESEFEEQAAKDSLDDFED